MLTPRFEEALIFATQLHSKQLRKGTKTEIFMSGAAQASAEPQAEKGQAGDDEQAHQARDRQPRVGLLAGDAESLHQARRAGEEPRQPR